MKAIQLTALLTGPDVPPINEVRSGSEPSGANSNIALEVTRVGAAQGARVPIKYSSSGSGQTLDEHRIYISLGIPIDDQDRDEQELRYVERLAVLAEKANPPLDPVLLNIYRTRKESLVHAFDRVFFENRLGLFDVVCTYASKAPGSWNGEIRAAPVRVDLVFAGHFFDQPEFNENGPKRP